MSEITFPGRYLNGDCGYFDCDDRLFYTTFNWINCVTDKYVNDRIAYDFLLKNGYRRSGSIFYVPRCENCSQCVPIRIFVNDFKISKSQRNVLKKNSCIDVSLVVERSEFVTDEKIFLMMEYDCYHNGKRQSFDKIKEMLLDMNSGYSGVMNMEYRLDGKLVGVGIIDVQEDIDTHKISSISSNYFYYDVSDEMLKRSLGVFSVLKEIEFCVLRDIPYYYLGYYIQNCRKMKYKANYREHELFLYDKWFRMSCDSDADSVLNEDFVIPFPAPDKRRLYSDLYHVTDDIPLQLLYSAYRQGVFPWFDEAGGDPVMWFNPKERFVIPTDEVHVPKSLRKFIKKTPFTYTVDRCFKSVMEHCRDADRKGQDSTWIGNKVINAYCKLHEHGYAHSFEVWKDGKLAGGFYGVLIGSVFFGESMFTVESDSAKSAFVLFAEAFRNMGGKLIDCQAYTDNMKRFGARIIPREKFIELLDVYIDEMLSGKINDIYEKF